MSSLAAVRLQSSPILCTTNFPPLAFLYTSSWPGSLGSACEPRSSDRTTNQLVTIMAPIHPPSFVHLRGTLPQGYSKYVFCDHRVTISSSPLPSSVHLLIRRCTWYTSNYIPSIITSESITQPIFFQDCMSSHRYIIIRVITRIGDRPFVISDGKP